MSPYADRVKETTTTTGTGNLTLDGAVTSFQSINAAFGTQKFFKYAIAHQSASEWETGRGYLTGSTTMVRESVQSSSNSNTFVSFSAGTKDVFVTLLADDIETKGIVQAALMGWAMP